MDSLYLDTFGDLPCAGTAPGGDRDAELELLLCNRCRGKPRHLLCYRCRLILITAEKSSRSSRTTKSSLELACSPQQFESGAALGGLGLARITVPGPPSLSVAPEPSHRQANVKDTAAPTAATAPQQPPSQAEHRDTSRPCHSSYSQSYRAHSCSSTYGGGSSGSSRSCRRASSSGHTPCGHHPPYRRDCPRCDSECYLPSGPRPIRHQPCHYKHHVCCCDCCYGYSGSCYTAGPDWPSFTRPLTEEETAAHGDDTSRKEG